ncbi:hypothetical protein PG993_005865 [Apiospora rasikravindrae]|uniref:Uncharacterized protein n=1 Tax=Apiospora rasikravindrae TaxID=990691 RepID=A0ABR1TA09_9PEZI
MSNTKRDQYVNTIAANGHKISRDRVMHAWPVHPHGTSELPAPRGQTRPDHMWVEVGNKGAGFEHVKHEHERDYANKGIPPDRQRERLPQYMEASTTVGRHIGYATKKQTRPVMSTYFKEEQRVVRNGMTVADNGFIVGMNPLSKEKVRRRPGDPQEVSDRTMENLYYYPPTSLRDAVRMQPRRPSHTKARGLISTRPASGEHTGMYEYIVVLESNERCDLRPSFHPQVQ